MNNEIARFQKKCPYEELSTVAYNSGDGTVVVYGEWRCILRVCAINQSVTCRIRDVLNDQ
jgi:hypothetical protein